MFRKIESAKIIFFPRDAAVLFVFGKNFIFTFLCPGNQQPKRFRYKKLM